MKKIAQGLLALCSLAVLALFLFPSDASLEIPGYVEKREVSLGFLVPGRISLLNVDEGQLVEPNQPLAALDPSLYLFDLEQSQATLRQKTAGRDFALKELDRQKNLQLSQTNSPRDYEQAYNQAIAASAEYDLALSRQSQALYRLEQATLLSPSSGVITRRLQEPGSVVSSNPVFTLTLTTPVWIRAYASAEQLSLCNPGTLVTVTTDTSSYQGQIGYISPQAEFTPKTIHTPDLRSQLVYRLRVVVTDPNAAELRQGIPVSIHLV